jgi:hypothetical protein
MKDRTTLLQETVQTEEFGPWRVLVVCQLLNRTTWIQVEPKLKAFFDEYPSPMSAVNDTSFYVTAYHMFASIGMVSTKLTRLRSMSVDFYRDWIMYEDKWYNYPVRTYDGCGAYAEDAWFLFVLRKPCRPADRRLVEYAKSHGLWLN